MTTTTISEKNHPERMTRTITLDGWTIKQISQGRVEGTIDEFYWWNIDITQTTAIPELGHKGRSWSGR